MTTYPLDFAGVNLWANGVGPDYLSLARQRGGKVLVGEDVAALIPMSWVCPEQWLDRDVRERLVDRRYREQNREHIREQKHRCYLRAKARRMEMNQ